MVNKYFLILKGNNKELAIKEFETLYQIFFEEEIKLENIENTLYFLKQKITLTKKDFLYRLTYTNLIVESKGEFKDLEDFKINLPNLKEFENEPFVIRVKKSKKNVKVEYEEKLLAKPIWDSFENPKVSIKDYEKEYDFIFTEKQNGGFYFGIKIFENNKDYLNRMPKQRPIKMPYTLKSDMARCSINLLKLKKGIILDPFCGIGGILLEAVDLGFEVIGNDISYNDLKYFKINFEHFFSQAKYIRILADSQTQFVKENSVDGIVTDIPYGRCSRKLGDDLYEAFLKNAKKMLKPNKRMVVIYSNLALFRELALKYFNEVYEIEEYINSSMTRHILVLENNK